jgi:MoaA/NifB/PqqE/SkfB family radical SAM enzyme
MYYKGTYFFKAEFITKEGFELNTISSDFLLNRNYYKSLRCKGCKFSTQCKGIYINHIRRFGFKILKPVKL